MKTYQCQQGLELNVYKSFAGYYIGTFICDGEDVGPNCRCSGYYKTREAAEQALEHRTFNRVCDENYRRHGGCGCQVKEADVND